LTHISDTTVYNALRAAGIKAYREEFKFILTTGGKQTRLAYCQARQEWDVEKEWANYGFTDEMSIEIGGSFGEC
jgi:hypothetical protein